MRRNNNKKKTKQRYTTPKIMDTFSEDVLLKKVAGLQWRVSSPPGWKDGIWDVAPKY